MCHYINDLRAWYRSTLHRPHWIAYSALSILTRYPSLGWRKIASLASNGEVWCDCGVRRRVRLRCEFYRCQFDIYERLCNERAITKLR